MSFPAFGTPATPPAASPAPAPPPEASKRPRALVICLSAAGVLALAGAAAFALGGGEEPIELSTGVTPPPAAVAEPTAVPTAPAAPPPVASVRNPFTALVTGTAPAVDASADPAGVGGTGSTSDYGSTGVVGSGTGGAGAGGSSGSSGSGSTGSTAPAPPATTPAPPATTPAPSPPSGGTAVTPLDAVATCTEADKIWEQYIKTIDDKTVTETMAGHVIGTQVHQIERLMSSTSVTALRQPLRAWSLEMGEIRALLVEKKAVRWPKEVPEDRTPSVWDQPEGALPAVDEEDVLTARTSQRERCFQLTDPLVAPEEF
jgi:hypothetical protein